MKYFALWISSADYGMRWAGPFTSNVTAREAVPADAMSSVITSPIAMTSGEALEASAIMGSLTQAKR